MRHRVPEMQVAIARAAQAIRAAVEREVSQHRCSRGRLPRLERRLPIDALEIVLDGNRISNINERPRETRELPAAGPHPRDWRPPGVEEDTLPEELEHALAGHDSGGSDGRRSRRRHLKCPFHYEMPSNPLVCVSQAP